MTAGRPITNPEIQVPDPESRAPDPKSRIPNPQSLALSAANGLLAVILAPQCAACGAGLDVPLDGPVCAACWASVKPITPPVCDACGDPLPSWRVVSLGAARCARCRRGAGAVDRSRAVGEYAGSLRRIIHALKYGRRRSVARRLAALMAASAGSLLEGVDGVVPVPLHPRRERERGFNQAAALAAHLGPPTLPVLRRVRETRPQVELPAARRHANVRRAFGLAPASRWRPSALPDLSRRCLLLVDDVATTGATLEACGRVLKDAGAREVRALTGARAVRRPPPRSPR